MVAQGRGSIVGTVGNIGGVPARIVVDPSVVSSTVRRSWLPHGGRFQTSPVYFPSAPLVIPCSEGYYHVRMPLLLQESQDWDVVLGADWIRRCWPEFAMGCIRRPQASFFEQKTRGIDWIDGGSSRQLALDGPPVRVDVSGSGDVALSSVELVKELKVLVRGVGWDVTQVIQHGLMDVDQPLEISRRRVARHVMEGLCSTCGSGSAGLRCTSVFQGQCGRLQRKAPC